MKRRSRSGWYVASAIGLVLLAPVAACENELAPSGGPTFSPAEITQPDSGVPFVPPDGPGAATPDATPDVAPDAASDATPDAEVDASPPPACDDGKIDPGETCDPLASCPTVCPAIQCQLRALEGAGTCGAKCTNTTMQTACVNGDGCCPASCNNTNDDDCAAVCGNSVVEPGETCDPLASCPATCPAVGCQLRTLQAGGTCTAKCVDDKLQTACVNNDGCCPAGCNANNDSDCNPGCGNNVIEPGETCDPLASCPLSCPQAKCQLRTLQNAGTCQAQCVDAGLQTACVNNDGCCPSGCNANNDNDCTAACGNGVVEKGETCDPLTSCPTACPQIACQLQKLDNAGTCQAVCSPAGLQTACVNDDGCCPSGCNANNDNDCTPACGNGVIEKGETCDPLTSCPTACPQIACQLQKLDNAGTCQAVCSPAGAQSACVNNDGCCPSGCNANNDNDCNPSCGNGVVEKGETCDPPGKCPTCNEQYTCYESTGSAATCDLVCHNPITKCGVSNDKCCPFDGAGGCDSTSDNDCNGGAWKWMMVPTAVDTSKGCMNVVLRGIIPGGSYDITTCAPPGQVTGGGDPNITQVIDDSQVNYPVGNDNCTDKTALPHLAKSDCMNANGQLTMACASPSPGGFIAGSKASLLAATICAGAGGGGTTPVYVWYNATQAPSATVVGQ